MRLIPFYILVISCFLLGTWGANHAVTVMAENEPITGRTCIVIDAGHGGVDGGTTSCTGVLESGINLEISLRLRDMLHLLGYQIHMIRTEDISIHSKGDTIAQKKISDLKNRVEIINKTENGILVSIHQNYFSDSRYSGAQVFYPATPESEQLAGMMQKALVQHLNPGSNRNSKKVSGVYLMEHIQCTGILIECGFLSNPEEEAKLRSEDYQKQLCCVIAATLSIFTSP